MLRTLLQSLGGASGRRTGDQLATTLDIPIGFVAVGVGGTQVSAWVPGTSNYNSRLKPSVQSFPVNGFRAALWHQGESDAIGGVSATTHASRLNSMISQSRIDAGWNIPWYIAEASWHSGGSHANQEGVVAGQRLAIHGDPLTFFGETTDDMHLKGSPLHFDIPRQLERSQQYTDIMTGNITVTPLNGHFEDNRDPAITGLSPLADGASELVVLTDVNAPRPLGWRILSANGLTAADGGNGFHNPSTGIYAGAVDTVKGGVLPNMDGKHVALLDDGTADNYFLHSTRALAEPDTIYTLTVALGVRDNPATFGDARLEITANGAVVASASFDKAALDALHGGDASGTFTDASVSWTTGGTIAANQPLAIRIVKEGGAGTVLDFDNVRFTTTEGGIEGDYNANGQVEQGDLDLTLLNWGRDWDDLEPSPVWVQQAPTEGSVDQAELDTVLLHWGNTAAVAEEAANLANYSSYDRGIRVDIARLADADSLRTIDDFMSQVGNHNDPPSWARTSNGLPVEASGEDAGRFDRRTFLVERADTDRLYQFEHFHTKDRWSQRKNLEQQVVDQLQADGLELNDNPRDGDFLKDLFSELRED